MCTNIYNFKVGVQIQMSAAGLYKIFDTDYANILEHTGSRGFKDQFEIVINSDGRVTSTFSASVDLYFLHGILMWVAWGFFGLLQLASNWYLKMFWRTSMWLHRLSGIVVWTITATMSLIVIY